MIRLYYPERLHEDLKLTGDILHYLENVMRVKIGFFLHLFNQIEGEYLYKITLITKKEIALTRIEKTREALILPSIRLAFAPIRQNRLSFLIEKATELGATELHPVLTDHTQHRDISIDRLNSVAQEATEQSGRFSPPQILEPISLTEFIEKNETFFCLDERKNAPSFLTIHIPLNPLFLIGPEGGFSAEEFKKIDALKTVQKVSLGDLILRAETAALKALSLVSEKLTTNPSTAPIL